MIKLLITLMLISPFSFAGWGDVYYCQMTTFSNISFEGKRTDYILEKFQFKLDKTKNAMVFGSSGYFKNTVQNLRPLASFPAIETWYADGDYSKSFFKDGKFIEATVSGEFGIISMSANCDKF
jgi:hypothetical protein